MGWSDILIALAGLAISFYILFYVVKSAVYSAIKKADKEKDHTGLLLSNQLKILELKRNGVPKEEIQQQIDFVELSNYKKAKA